MLASLLPSVLANIVAPALAYALIRPHVASSATALLAAMAIPAGWTLATFAWRRRADRLGLLSVAVSAIALAVTYLTSGSALALELQDPAETGAIGLACMVSVLARRPLYLTVLRLLARRNAQAARMLSEPAIQRSATVETAIIAAILLVHAIVITILALTLPTATFLAVYRLVGLPIIAAGLSLLIWYRHRRRATPRRDITPQAGGADDDQTS
jgi:O-antigen/teichoic acid export membrane protein